MPTNTCGTCGHVRGLHKNGTTPHAEVLGEPCVVIACKCSTGYVQMDEALGIRIETTPGERVERTGRLQMPPLGTVFTEASGGETELHELIERLPVTDITKAWLREDPHLLVGMGLTGFMREREARMKREEQDRPNKGRSNFDIEATPGQSPVLPSARLHQRKGFDSDRRLMTGREMIVDVLVRHRPTENSACRCGGVALGRSWPEHVADVIIDKLLSKAME